MLDFRSLLAVLTARFNDETTRSYVHFRYSSTTIIRSGAIAFGLLLVIEAIISNDLSWFSIGARGVALAAWLSLFYVVRSDAGTSNYHRFFWTIILNFCIPFVLLFSYLLHATEPPIEQDVRYFVVITYFIALCVYTQLVNSFLGASIGLFTSTSLAIGVVTLVNPGSYSLATESMTILISQQLTAVLIGSVTNRNPEIARYDSYNAAKRIGHKIANDLRIPLGDILTRSQVSARTLPTIIEGYTKAVEAGLVEGKLNNRQLEVIAESPADIENEARDAETLIDMLLVNIAEEPIYGQAIEAMHASDLLQSAYERYPYSNDDERSLVTNAGGTDFVISGPRLLLHHVIYNMLKNALYYVQKAEKGDVTISIEAADGSNQNTGGVIRVHDTGPGIPAANLASVFNRFFTTTETGRGSGIGLHFCRTVIENMGGRIEVKSEYGAWTTFSIHFPEAKMPEVTFSSRE